MNAAPALLLSSYDRDPTLHPNERVALAILLKGGRRSHSDYRKSHAAHDELNRLLVPLHDIFLLTTSRPTTFMAARERFFVARMHKRQSTYWSWDREEWLEAARDARGYRYSILAAAYVLGGIRNLETAQEHFRHLILAQLVFGREAVDEAVATVRTQLSACGYQGREIGGWDVTHAIGGLMLLEGTARLNAITPTTVRQLYEAESPHRRHGLRMVVLALRTAGILVTSPLPDHANSRPRVRFAARDVPEEWRQWCQRWADTSTLTPAVRSSYTYALFKVGRWLATHHPNVTTPEEWTRDTCLAWLAGLEGMAVGDFAYAPQTRSYAKRVGQPLGASTKDGDLSALRTFFRDLQEWGWISRRFDPSRSLATPRSVKALIGPSPRCIADDIWAKLLWAGLNLTSTDVPEYGWCGTSWYPFEMVRAVTLLWLFSGLRSNEIARLRVGCIRWQDDKGTCLLDIPVHKTGTAFTKPVDPMVGKAISEWEAVRPDQPTLVDEKTGESVDLLFARKGQRISISYINRALIPMLCTKANVPQHDVRGAITSHRARSTIATQLYNAKEPLTLFELQAWLGHKSPSATQHYARITPTTLSKAYSDAGYFARNVRTIEVLLDREAVTTGAVSSGAPWQYFDLGHGFCTYDFFEQCPHRMACAKCDFYLPKDSSKAQLLEARNNLQRMRVEIPLTDDERAAVEDGEAAVERLIAQLADVPTPAGPTPRLPRFPNLKTLRVVDGSPSSDSSAD